MRIKTSLVVTCLAVAMLYPGSAQAISIPEFNKLPVAVQVNYVNALYEAVIKALVDAGRPEDAAKANQLLNRSTLGTERFLMALALLQADDAKTGKHSEVADAVVLALGKSDVKVPDSFSKLAEKIKAES